MFCPPKNNPNYKKLASVIGSDAAYVVWNKADGRINFQNDAYYNSLLMKHEGNEHFAVLDYVQKYKNENYREAIYNNEYYNNIVTDFQSKFKDVGVDVNVKTDYNINESGRVEHIGNGKFEITVNPVNMKADTLFHEFGHIFVDILGYENPLIQSAIEIAKNSNIYNKIELLYKDKFKDLTPEIRDQLINKEVLTTLLSEEVSSLYREKTQMNRWQSIKNAIFEAIQKFFGVNRNAVEQLAYDMVFNPISINKLNRSFESYVQFQIAKNLTKNIDNSIDKLYNVLYDNVENVKKYLNTINESDFNNAKKQRLAKYAENIVHKDEWKQFEKQEKKGYLLNILKHHNALQDVFRNSLKEVEGSLIDISNHEGISIKDMGTEEYRNKLIANLVEFNNIYELIDGTNRDIEAYFNEGDLLDEITKLGFEKIEADRIRKIFNDVRKLSSNVRKLNNDLQFRLNPAREKVLNYLLEKYSNNNEFMDYFSEGESVAGKLIKGEIKIKDTSSIGIELDALLNSKNPLGALVSKIYSMQEYKMRIEKNKKMKKLDNTLKNSQGIIRGFVNESGFFFKKHDLKSFWSDYRAIKESKARRDFIEANVEMPLDFYENVNKIKEKYEELAKSNNLVFDLSNHENIGTILYISAFKSEVEKIGGVIREYTNRRHANIVEYNVYPKIDNNSVFKTNKYVNQEYLNIESNKDLLDKFNLIKEICEDLGLLAYDSLTNTFDAHIPFENKNVQNEKPYSKEFTPESVREDINGLIIKNQFNPLKRLLEQKPHVTYSKDLKNALKHARSIKTIEAIEKRILKEVNQNKSQFQVPNEVVFNSLEDIKKYNSKITSENQLSHQAALNMDNLESRIMELFKKGYELEAKKEIHTKLVFLLQQVNKINKTGKQDWNNTAKQIKRFYNQVYNGDFKNDPHNIVNKAIDQVTYWTSRVGMGLNLHSGIKNIGTGVSENLIESSAFYTKTEYSKAAAKVFSLLPTFAKDWSLPEGESSTKEGAIFKNLPIFQSIRAMADMFTTNNNIDTKNKIMKYADDVLFFMQDTTEFYLQNTLYLAMLHSHRVVDGKILSLGEFKKRHNKTKQDAIELTEKQKAKIFEKYEGDIVATKRELDKAKSKLQKETIEARRQNKLIEADIIKEFESHKTVFDSIDYIDGVINIAPELIDEVSKFMTRVKVVNQSNQGIYNINEKSSFERHGLFRMAMQFRHWALPFWDKRFGRVFFREYFDEGMGSIQKGMYHSLLDYAGLGLVREAVKEYALMPVTTKAQVSRINYVFEALKERYRKFAVYNEMMTDVDKNNLKRVMNDTVMLSTFLLAYFMLKQIGDNDKERMENSFFLQMALYQADAVSTEIASMNPFYGMGNEMSKIIRTPAASLMTLKNANNFAYHTLGYPFMTDEKRTFSIPEHKGRPKALIYGMKSTPGLNQLYRIYNMPRNYQFYRLRKKPFVQFFEDYFPDDFRKM